MNIYLQKKPKRINSVSVTMTIVALVAGYLLWFWIPTYWPIFQLSGIMKGACNTAYREHDNEKVLQSLLDDARRTRLRLSKDNFRISRGIYTDEELKALPGTNKDTWQQKGKTCVIEMHYEDDYTWPLLGWKRHLVFEKRVEEELTPVIWKKNDYSLPECRCVQVPGRRSTIDGRKRSQQNGGPKALRVNNTHGLGRGWKGPKKPESEN